ncbi:TPA: hypothetical protein ENS27_20230 [bacterium]|jgi:hypothetical protein|nr:hypothetical protein [bacterium]
MENSVADTKIRFIADEMLGKLAKWLRILGYDTIYYREKGDNGLIQRALDENRIILTRDTKLSERKLARKCLLIKSENFWKQFEQVIKELDLDIKNKLFTRCLVCNSELIYVEKESIKEQVPEYTYQNQTNFYKCPNCERIYWAGTHRESMADLINKW